MDPTTALIEALDEIAQGNRSNGAQKLRDLSDWLLRDGFCPEVEVQHHAHKVVVTIEKP